MALTMVMGLGTPRENDEVTKQQAARKGVVDPTDSFEHETIEAEFGDKFRKLTLKFPVDGHFVFAVYADNPEWHKVSRDTWYAAAADALEKFCAMHGLTALYEPRQEITNRYNLQIETREIVR